MLEQPMVKIDCGLIVWNNFMLLCEYNNGMG